LIDEYQQRVLGMLESISLIFAKVIGIYAEQIPIMIGLALAFTALACFESQQGSKGKVWWKNPGLGTDITYGLVHAVAAPYFKLPIFIVLTFLMSGSMTPDQINDYFANGKGPLSALPFWAQGIFYLVVGDFLMYWLHRMFHNASMWRFHAIHHSATQVDWTTTYRFHPVNIILQPALVSMIMLFLGIRPDVMAFFLAFDILSAAVVHANVNWTFGPLKYVIASPVFHRWHHGPADEGGSSNFAPTFAFWDYLFGTFYMPEGKLPQNFGVDDRHFPEGYVNQLIYPFKPKAEEQPSNPAPVS
jgi:sterol desaturase/sphingolipid hydroxylase (fatty acid hydroxylase superfamily)